MMGSPLAGKLYMQVQYDLQRRISSGEFKPEEMLPTEEQLCREYGVSRITVRRAFDGLVADLFVVRRQGVGTFVAGISHALQSVRLRAYLEDILALDRHLRFQLLGIDTQVASERVAERLRLTKTAHVAHESTIVLLNDQPFMVGEGFFPADLVHSIEPGDFTGHEQPTERILNRAGLRIAYGEQNITATAISKDFGAHLDLKPGTPVLSVERLYFDDRGMPIAFITGVFHPERYQLTADIVPRGGAAPQIVPLSKDRK
ncbi:GntR family transcriptional regulator [Ensifer sp. Root31]|uniref:GntR family transcriptional regulator n=1 Tax=Ensifer sp. Root31 TaxID=1736512 RepID=UPI0009EC7CF8|nr:GntR family transcriptional regulator [Ensifer sp. Root31]